MLTHALRSYASMYIAKVTGQNRVKVLQHEGKISEGAFPDGDCTVVKTSELWWKL